MTSAFLVKDARIASRLGAVLPGVPTILLAQGIAFAAAGAWAVTVGTAPTPAFWGTVVTGFASVAFFLAALGPVTAGAVGALQEAVPEIAESLAAAPVRPFDLFLGKAALPVIQGLAVQAGMLPTWLFLAGAGVMPFGAAMRVFLCACALVPMGAIVGATRFVSPGSPKRVRGLAGFRRPGQTQPQQLWIFFAALFWSAQFFRGIGAAAGAGGVWASVLDAVRPLVPMLLLDAGAHTTLFRLAIPSILLTPLIVGFFVVGRVGGAVATSVRAEPADRARAIQALLLTRAAFSAYLLAALWPAGAQVAQPVAALYLVLASMAGIPGETRVSEARSAALTCLVPGALGAIASGFAGIAFWLGTAATAAAVAAAFPPRKDEKRGIAFVVMMVVSIGAPIAAVVLQALVLIAGPLVSLAGAVTCVSILAAPLSLAQDLFGAVPLWESVESSVAVVHAVRPWICVPLFYGAVAGIAIWRGSRKKG